MQDVGGTARGAPAGGPSPSTVKSARPLGVSTHLPDMLECHGHLPPCLRDTPADLRVWGEGGVVFDVHTQILSLESAHMAGLIAAARGAGGNGALPLLQLLPDQPPAGVSLAFLPELLGQVYHTAEPEVSVAAACRRPPVQHHRRHICPAGR